MDKHKKIIKWLWVSIIAIHVNFIVFLFADYSLWYFFGFLVFIGLLVWEIYNLEKHK